MGTAAAHRQALWDREKAERKTAPKPQGLTPPAKRNNFWTSDAWAVVREYDDGRRTLVRDNLSARGAERLAGELRDAMTDAQCAEGWNYQARRTKGNGKVRLSES
jgi:hypothetical protein